MRSESMVGLRLSMKRIDVRKADTTHTAYVWRLALKVDAWYHGRFTQSIEYRYLKKHHCEVVSDTAIFVLRRDVKLQLTN